MHSAVPSLRMHSSMSQATDMPITETTDNELMGTTTLGCTTSVEINQFNLILNLKSHSIQTLKIDKTLNLILQLSKKTFSLLIVYKFKTKVLKNSHNNSSCSNLKGHIPRSKYNVQKLAYVFLMLLKFDRTNSDAIYIHTNKVQNSDGIPRKSK